MVSIFDKLLAQFGVQTDAFKQEKKEKFVARMEKTTAFKALITTDVNDARRTAMAEGFEKIALLVFTAGSATKKDKVNMFRLILEATEALYFETASQWLRAMDNDWLDRHWSMFLDHAQKWGHIPEAVPFLIRNLKRIINLSWSGQDIDVLPPFFINNTKEGEKLKADTYTHTSGD